MKEKAKPTCSHIHALKPQPERTGRQGWLCIFFTSLWKDQCCSENKAQPRASGQNSHTRSGGKGSRLCAVSAKLRALPRRRTSALGFLSCREVTSCASFLSLWPGCSLPLRPPPSAPYLPAAASPGASVPLNLSWSCCFPELAE